MKLLDSDIVKSALTIFDGTKFTTQDFIEEFKVKNKKIYDEVILEYGVGGKGSGKNFSSNVYFGKSLSQHTDELALTFIDYIKAPKGWGNSVVAFWEYNTSNSESVRYGVSVEVDITSILNDTNLTATEKELFILSRIGQGKFRTKLIEYWKICPITKCNNVNLLVASHIKPWSASNNQERLDVYNGLLLTPNIDKLFDKGFISFTDSGELICSSYLPDETRKTFGISSAIKINIESNHVKYMTYHRENILITKE